jgi:hypothetical protein
MRATEGRANRVLKQQKIVFFYRAAGRGALFMAVEGLFSHSIPATGLFFSSLLQEQHP